MDPARLFESEPLLVSAVALSAIGLALIILLVLRIEGLRRVSGPVQAARAAISAGDASGGTDGRCRALLEALPDAVALCDPNGRLVAANEAFARLSAADDRGQVSPSWPGLRVLDARPPELREDGTAIVDEKLETGTGPRWVSWVETTLSLGGEPHRLRSGREITDRLATEQALEAARLRAEAENHAKSRMLAHVSHEFRTPLNGIMGMSRLLLDTSLTAEQTTYVQAVRSSAEAFLSLIEDILDSAQIEAGRMDLADETFDLPALVQGVVELLAPRAQGKGTEIACFVSGAVARDVRGDPDRLRQVLLNVAGNAVKFTSSGGVGILVEGGEADTIVITVEDTGPGIAAERRATIFEEFDRGGLATGDTGSTGLGLAITRRLVERMGGRIDVDSEVGRGSRFRITLGLPAASDPARTGIVEPVPPTGCCSVILLSGSPFEAPYLARTLGEAGIRARVVGTLEAAQALMAREPFDVVIADHAVTDTDVRVIPVEAARHGVTRSIVLLSPFERRDFGSPHAAGFDAYLVKPVRTRSLFERLGAEAEARPVPATKAAPVEPVRRPSSLRVLLAEDNDINALLAMRSLEKLGAVVVWAKDGLAALARAEEALAGEGPAFDVVLTDVRMPGLDGLELVRRIRARETETGATVPSRIVLLSASLPALDAAEMRRAGIDGCLGKPFELDELARVLDGPEAPLALAS